MLTAPACDGFTGNNKKDFKDFVFPSSVFIPFLVFVLKERQKGKLA